MRSKAEADFPHVHPLVLFMVSVLRAVGRIRRGGMRIVAALIALRSLALVGQLQSVLNLQSDNEIV